MSNDLPDIPEITKESWSQWYDCSGCKLEEIWLFRPGTVDLLREVIKATVKAGVKIRVAGTGHSLAPLFTNSDGKYLLILTENLERPDKKPRLELIEDKETCMKQVAMAASVTTEEFAMFQLENDIVLPTNTPIQVVQMGGVVAGASHGVGWDVQTVSDYVVSMKVVDSQGELRTFTMEEDPEMMRSLQCHLGLWGVIVEMTFKVLPMMTVKVEHQQMKVNDLFYNQEKFCEILQNNWSVEIFWFPFNSKETGTLNDTDEKGTKENNSTKPSLEEQGSKLEKGSWDPKEDEIILRVINVHSQSQEDTRHVDDVDTQIEQNDNTENEDQSKQEEGEGMDDEKVKNQSINDVQDGTEEEKITEIEQKESNDANSQDTEKEQNDNEKKTEEDDSEKEKDEQQKRTEEDGEESQDKEGEKEINDDIEGEKQYTDVNFKAWLSDNGHDGKDYNFIKANPQLAPSFLKSQMEAFLETFTGNYLQKLPHAIHFRDHDDDMKVRAMEWAFNIDADCSNICKASQGVVELVEREALKGAYPMNQPLNIRCISYSDAYMAPAICGNQAHGGSGHTCYMEMVGLAHTPDWEDFGCYVASVWGLQQGARPHWCKEWKFLPDINTFLRKAYKRQIPIFLGHLERSGVDPGGVFFNKALEEIFYPKGHPGRNRDTTRTEPDQTQPEGGSCACSIL